MEESQNPPTRSSSLPAPTDRGKMRDEVGPFILQKLVDDLPLETEGYQDVRVTCVELWEENLYVGTSASEILHFFKLPPQTPGGNETPQFILASRLQPPSLVQTAAQPKKLPGVQQILLLLPVSKAVVICNGHLSFFSLPEFTPAYGTTKLKDISWVGFDENDLELRGLPRSLDAEDRDVRGVQIYLGTKKVIRLLRIGEEVRLIKDVPFPASSAGVLRHPTACVANATNYSLVDMNNVRIATLPPITSSASEPSPPATPAPVTASAGHLRSQSRGQGHARTGSLGFGDIMKRRCSAAAANSPLRPQSPSSPGSSRAASPGVRNAKSPTPSDAPSEVKSASRVSLLPPHLASPTPTEFLITTGTELDEPSVGMFVDLEGDPVMRGTLEFTRYPRKILIEGPWVVSLVGGRQPVECHRWDSDSAHDDIGSLEGSGPKIVHLDEISEGSDEEMHVGITKIVGAESRLLSTVAEKLKLVRLGLLPKQPVPFKKIAAREPLLAITKTLSPGEDDSMSDIEAMGTAPDLDSDAGSSVDDDEPIPSWEVKRNAEEEVIATRISTATSKLLLFRDQKIYLMIETPLLLKLDSQLPTSMARVSTRDMPSILRCISATNSLQPTTDSQFYEIGYIRQKLGLLLLGVCLTSASSVSPDILERTDTTLQEGGVDPRVVIGLFGFSFRQEIVEGEETGGVWVYGGIKNLVEDFMRERSTSAVNDAGALQFLKTYLFGWRAKKGFGSTSDDVFATVDMALLRVLLVLDSPQYQPPNTTTLATTSSSRQELYNLVSPPSDKSSKRGSSNTRASPVARLENPDRAVKILEEFGRLYVLSRLYGQLKQPRDVLATWRRILAKGDKTEGGEFIDGELQVRGYLSQLKDASLVEEYGSWLARRNPKLGVQLFSDESAKVKFEPPKVVEILKLNAPDAVKGYLEYLVVEKQNTAFANDLIFLFLTQLTTDLSSILDLEGSVRTCTDTYRALTSPKPSYIEFITDNFASSGDEWWRNRVLLLKFLAGDTGYDVSRVLEKVLPWQEVLVAEMVVLRSREGRSGDEEALRLLCRELGDYETAVKYCLNGGAKVLITKPELEKKGVLREDQSRLFDMLLVEFLSLEDFDDRIEQTSRLLERFGGWLDVNHVLEVIPDSWSVDILSGFLISALRKLVKDKNETMIHKALSRGLHDQLSLLWVEKCEEIGPTFVAGDGDELLL